MLRGLKLRDARRTDKQAVLDFCKNTWRDYGDFIPHVWDEWIRQRRGRLIVAELKGRPIGIAKITDFGNGEIWLEGLRVDRRYRRKGVAGAINKEVLRTLRRIKPRRVRFCTGQTNRASRRIGRSYGFEAIARFRYYWQRTRKGKVKGEIATLTDLPAVYDFVTSSRFIKLASGLIAEGWVFREFSRRLLRNYIKAGKVLVMRGDAEIRGVAIYPLEKSENGITLGFVDGDERAIKILARNCMYLGFQCGKDYCSVVVPSRFFPKLIEEAGYKRKESAGQVVMEYRGKALV